VLNRWGRRRRLVASAVVGGLLLAGTLWGEDDHFPFGPFHMFAHANRPTGRVTAAELHAVDASGRAFRVGAAGLGLRRAELEGQIPRFEADPAALAVLADAWRRVHPDAPALLALRLEHHVHRLVDGRVTGEERELLAEWRAS
jgi:hypothetical protein